MTVEVIHCESVRVCHDTDGSDGGSGGGGECPMLGVSECPF
jgi:hypothetical protein